MKIKQNAVHSNATVTVFTYNKQDTTRRTTDSHSNANGNEHSRNHGNYADWTRYGNAGDWCGDCHQYGCSDYSRHNNHNNYSEKYSYSNYGQETQTGQYTINSNNASPVMSGASTMSRQSINSILINLSGVGYSDDQGRSSFGLYYRYRKNQSSSWGNWVFIANTNATSYTWNITSLAVGYYQIAVTGYDGSSWSAILSNGVFINDHKEALSYSNVTSGNTRTVTQPSDTTAYEKSASYAVSSEFGIFRYTPPTWLTDPWKKATIDQLREQLNVARTNMGLASYTFSNTSVVSNFTVVHLNDIKEAQTQINEIYKAAGKSTTNFSGKSYMQPNAEVSKEAITDIQKLLDALGK